MKSFCLATVFLFAPVLAFACFQIGPAGAVVYGSTISGRVLREEKTIPRVLVTLQSNGKVIQRARTNFDGVFEMRNVPEGRYQVVIERWGKGQIVVESLAKGTYAPLLFTSTWDGCIFVERNG
jgi:hypothetical protein